MNDHHLYENPLITRYASKSMSQRWGAQRKHRTWRQLWLALAEAQYELGLLSEDGKTPRIRAEQLEELRQHLDDIDFERAALYEKKLRHDVMAHIHTFGEVVPKSREIVHLGATSCYVTDNTDLILMRESLSDLCWKLAWTIDALAQFAEKWRSEPTLGFTHFQPAQLTTVGKRATLWCYDLIMDLHDLEYRRDNLLFRGAKGTTGTQASFLALFHGDHNKVRQLDLLVAKKMGFDEIYTVTGQTYSRKVDSQILDALSGIGQSLHKWGTDLRLLAHRQEIDEPFESDQIGSSAMPYKRNPMRAERMCSLSRFVMGLPQMSANSVATQWFERTLDDSAIRRLYIPQAFLACDGALRIALNLAKGLVVNQPIIAKSVREYLPYICTENLLLAAVARGGDRQEIHEVIRKHSHTVTEQIKNGRGSPEDLIGHLENEPCFQGIDVAEELDPLRYTGRSSTQVFDFIETEIEPIRLRYSGESAQNTQLDV